jgi:hypothetical protein
VAVSFPVFARLRSKDLVLASKTTRRGVIRRFPCATASVLSKKNSPIIPANRIEKKLACRKRKTCRNGTCSVLTSDYVLVNIFQLNPNVISYDPV